MSATVSPNYPALHAGLAVLVAHQDNAQWWVNRNAQGGDAEHVAAWVATRDERQAMVTAYEAAIASCHALIKEGDTQKAIDLARKALGLPV